MAVTIQSVMDLARGDLNDADKVRYADAELLKYANDGIARVKVMRPDLNWGNFATAYSDLLVTNDFPFGLEYRQPIADYIVAMAEKSDDPFAVEQRAVQGLKLFITGLGMG